MGGETCIEALAAVGLGSTMDMLTGILLGIGLSAACGFRIFVPLLFISAASISGHLTLASGFQWLGSYAALVSFGVATILEVGGYYIPWLDHLLDTLATPAAIIAGTVITAAMITKMDPMLKWTLAVIAGGGVAGMVQGSTALTRAVSTATTAGIGNPLFATIELGGSIVTTLMAFVMPWVTVALLVVCFICFGRKFVDAIKQRFFASKGSGVNRDIKQ
jgi:hypothetical protein